MDLDHLKIRLNGFINKTNRLLRKRPSNRQDLQDLIADFKEIQKDFPDYNKIFEEIIDESANDSSIHDVETISKSFRRIHNDVEEKLNKLNELLPIFNFVETKLQSMEHWTKFHDPNSEMAEKSIKERADLVDQLGAELTALERPENAPHVNVGTLREVQKQISTLFVVRNYCTYYAVVYLDITTFI